MMLVVMIFKVDLVRGLHAVVPTALGRAGVGEAGPNQLKAHLAQVVEHLEHGHDGEAHAEAEDTAAVGHEPDDGDALVAEDLGHHRLLDVDVDQGQVVPGVLEAGIHELVPQASLVGVERVVNTGDEGAECRLDFVFV